MLDVKVVNETPLPDRQVEAVVRRVAEDLEVWDRRTLVKIRHSSWGVAGKFYQGGAPTLWSERRGCYVRTDMHGQHHLAILRIPKRYPVSHGNSYARSDEPPTFVMESWQEALAAIAGHELMHLRQWHRPRSKRKHRGRFNEIETQFAAYRAWRREHAIQQKRRGA